MASTSIPPVGSLCVYSPCRMLLGIIYPLLIYQIMSIYCCTYFNKEVFKQIEVNVDLIYFIRRGILQKISFHLHRYSGHLAPSHPIVTLPLLPR